MRSLKKLSSRFQRAWADEGFLSSIKQLEGLVSRILSIFMSLVILVATWDLGRLLIQEIAIEPTGFFKSTLFEIFGLFLNVLIALEILENITAYFRNHVIQVELVISTSLIAVARKVIIFDLDKSTGVDLIGLAVAVFALSISYWIIHRSNKRRMR